MFSAVLPKGPPQGSTKGPPRVLQGSSKGAPRFHQGSTKVHQGFPKGPTRVVPKVAPRIVLRVPPGQGSRKGSLRVLHGSSSSPQRALESTYAHDFSGGRLASTRPNIYLGHTSARMIPNVVTAVRSCADPHGWAH